MKRAILVTALVFAWATAASAAVIRVPEDFGTIYEGVDAAAAGDSVLIGPGTWTMRDARDVLGVGSLPVRAHAFPKTGVTIIGTEGPERTVLEGEPRDPSYIDVILFTWGALEEPITLVGLTLRGMPGSEEMFGYTGILNTSYPGLDLRDCVLENNTRALYGPRLPLVARNCVFRGNDATASSPISSCIESDFGDWDIQDCLFEGNINGRLIKRQSATYATTIRNCRFIGNEGGRLMLLYDQSPLLIEGNWLEENVGAENQSGSCIEVLGCDGLIAGNTFVNNRQPGGGSGVLLVSADTSLLWSADIISNTIYGTKASSGSNCAGVVLLTFDVPVQFYANIIAGCRGAPAVLRGLADYNPTDGCNVFWDNDSGNFSNYIPAPSDFVIDPRFCDPGALDFHLRASSPCLPQNHMPECPDLIGALGEGCPGDGVTPVGLRTTPFGYVVTADGVSEPAPALFGWDPGTTHTIAASVAHDSIPGVRIGFHSWSDGGEREHEIVPGMNYLELTAAYQLEYQINIVIDGPGTVPHDGWSFADSVCTLTAVPEEGYVLAEWIGSGPGAYSGTDNPAAFIPYGPVTETAVFAPAPTLLTMEAGFGGTVTPGTGDQPYGHGIEIEAHPDPQHAFAGWTGTGNGSYTGTDNPATVTMNEPITQVAEFIPMGYEVTLSLSDTDPHVHTGDPVGLGNVYLWLDCTTDGGVSGLTLDLAGTLQPVAFQPAPGVVSAGSPTHLDLAMFSCPSGPTLLGTLVVLSPGEGSLCVDTEAAAPLSVRNCRVSPQTVYWPDNVRITGVRTDGGVPCAMGHACDQLVEPDDVVGAPIPPAAPVVYTDRFDGAVPNPFRAATSIRFSMAAAGRVRLSVFDVAGRRVRTLLNGERPAGSYDVPWSALGDDGAELPAGIYFVQLDAGPIRETRKVVRLGR